MRSRNAILNIFASLLLQALTAISGLLVSRLILQTFGSEVNGLVTSIVQFLSYVSLLEAGVGGVIRAALFKPLADHNDEQISQIIKATRHFFKNIAYVFSVYVLILAVAYPFVVKGTFSWLYVFSLILIISVSTFFEYFFCLPYINLLSADQKVWIINLLNSAIVVINIGVLYLAISSGLGIHGVKICGILVYAIKPVFYATYVKRHYHLIETTGQYEIKQKWNGLVHNVAQYVFNNTDVALISLLINVAEVSVYSVYYAVASGIERIITSVSVGCAAGIGDVIVRNEKSQLNRIVDLFEFVQSASATIFFSITAVLIVPFVNLYTSGVTDVDYVRPLFAYMLVLAELMYCIRSVYSTIILNAGHYKQTQINAIIEAVTNLVVSLILISKLGITGVAIGTFCGMLVRTIMDVNYLSRNIADRSVGRFVKCILANSIVFALSCLLGNLIPIDPVNWGIWILNAVIVSIVTATVGFVVYWIFYKPQIQELLIRMKIVH